MTLDPIAQLSLCLFSLFGGVAFGLAADLGKIARILLGAYLPPPTWRARYERPLPWLSRGVGWRKTAPRRAWVRGVGAVFDLAFPVLAALYLLLVSFRFNSGALRLSAIPLFLLGLGLFRVLCSARLSGAFAYLAYVLAVFGVYLKVILLLPPKLLWRVARRLLILPLVRLLRVIARGWALRRTRAMCAAQLAAAEAGFLQSSRKNRKRKWKLCRKKEGEASRR
jgi:hypothetical protein